MLNAELVADVSPGLLAVSVYPVPVLFSVRLLNVATPFTVFCVTVPPSVLPPGLLPIAMVMGTPLVVTRAPVTSCSSTVMAGVDGLARRVDGGLLHEGKARGRPRRHR
jgi:hypothetical protein